jgi:hypothetical protein
MRHQPGVIVNQLKCLKSRVLVSHGDNDLAVISLGLLMDGH